MRGYDREWAHFPCSLLSYPKLLGSKYPPGLSLDLMDDLGVTFPKVGMYLERPQLLVPRAGCGAVAKRQLGERLSLRCDRRVTVELALQVTT